MLTAYIDALGCTENMLDARRYRDFLEQNGYVITKDFKEADIILLLTCGVTSYVGNESLEKFNYYQKNKKEVAEVIIGGCLPFIEEDKIDSKLKFRSSHGDVSQLAELLKLTNYKYNDSDYGHEFFTPPVNTDSDSPLPNKSTVANSAGKLKKMVLVEQGLEQTFSLLGLERPMYFRRVTEEVYKEAYFVHIERGCGGNCTYCAIKFVKGDTISKSIPLILYEIMKGYELGKTEIVLAGDDTGSYGNDINCDFYDLMNEILKMNLPLNYTIRNFEPFWVIHNLQKLEDLLESGRIASICVPIQSGSSRLLKRMGRFYTCEEVLDALEEIKVKYPKVILSTHYMVGFPDEMEEDFVQTLDSVKKYFDFIRYSMYTDRPNTMASRMERKVSMLERFKRMKRLEETVSNTFKIKYENHVKDITKQLQQKLLEVVDEPE